MGKWIKHYADGTKYVGTDLAIKARMASWQNSNNDGIVAVELEHQGYTLKIQGLGTYWQSDNYSTVFPGTVSSLAKRRIEKQITSSDKFFRIYTSNDEHTIVFNNDLFEGKWVIIPPAWHGEWLILEYDVRTKTSRHYLRGTKL